MRAALLVVVFAAAAQVQDKPPPLPGGLAERLKSDEASTRMKAVHEVAKLGPKGAAAVPELIHICKTDVSRRVRNAAVMALAPIGPAAKEAVPLLIIVARGGQGGGPDSLALFQEGKQLQDLSNNGGTRIDAIDVLGVIRDPKALPVLIEVMEAAEAKASRGVPLESTYFRRAALAIGRIGVNDAKAVAILQRALNFPDEGRQAREAANAALRQLSNSN